MKYTTILLAAALAQSPLFADSLSFNRLSTIRNGDPAELFAKSAAEIVRFDPVTGRMFVVNAATKSIDIFDASNPSSPSYISSIDVSATGVPNSVDYNPIAARNEIAVAVASTNNAERGSVLFFTKDGEPTGSIQVGYLPDMLTYNSNGMKLVVANEGEPTPDYSFDPEGSVSIITMRGRNRIHSEVAFSHLTLSDVPGVRITGPEGTTVAQDLEPEYVAIQGRYAYVTLQENNAVVKIDIFKETIEEFFPLGSINHAELGNALDVSDRDDMVRIANWPVRGLLMPDAIATYSVKGPRGRPMTYFVTANEGDARDLDGYSDEARVKSLDLDPSAFPLATELKKDENLGRLTVVTTEGDLNGDGKYQELYSFGSRSFSIFDDNGNMVFDSGSMFEVYIAENYPESFNINHTSSSSFDTRSDNKGPEPEGVVIGEIDGRTYAFIGLERFGGIFAYDITNPHDVSFAGFGINRDFSVEYSGSNLTNVAAAGDLGVEGLDFVHASKSPTGQPLLIAANEVSGTITIYQLQTTLK